MAKKEGQKGIESSLTPHYGKGIEDLADKIYKHHSDPDVQAKIHKEAADHHLSFYDRAKKHLGDLKTKGFADIDDDIERQKKAQETLDVLIAHGMGIVYGNPDIGNAHLKPHAAAMRRTFAKEYMGIDYHEAVQHLASSKDVLLDMMRPGSELHRLIASYSRNITKPELDIKLVQEGIGTKPEHGYELFQYLNKKTGIPFDEKKAALQVGVQALTAHASGASADDLKRAFKGYLAKPAKKK